MSARRPAFPNIDVNVGVWRKLEGFLHEVSISGRLGHRLSNHAEVADVSGRRPLACSCWAVSPPLLQCTNLLFIFSITTHTLVEKQPPCSCVVPRLCLCLHRLRAERGQQELFTLCTWCRTYSTCHGGYSRRTLKWSSCICDVGVGPWLCAWFLSFSDFLILPGFIDFTADEVVSIYVCLPLSLLILSRTAVFVLLARTHCSTSPSCLVIFEQCGRPLAAPSPLCLYSCLVGHSSTSLHKWRS